MGGNIEVGHLGARHEAERVEARFLVTAVAVAGDQLQNTDLPALVLGADAADRRRPGTAGILGKQEELFTHTIVRRVLADARDTGELFEIGPPVFGNRIRRYQILFVEFFDIGCILGRELRRTPLPLHLAVLHDYYPNQGTTGC